MKTKDQTEYPQETWGSRVARKVRKEANLLCDSERDELTRIAVEIINGRNPTARRADRSGH